MSDQAFVGRVFFEIGDQASPVTYTRVCEINGIGGLGESNDQVETTTFCSNGFREYIGGLADGSEVTLDGNFIVDSVARRTLIDAVKNKLTLPARVVVDDDNDGATDLTFWHRAAFLSWQFLPNVADKNAIQWTYKVSGEIDITEP